MLERSLVLSAALVLAACAKETTQTSSTTDTAVATTTTVASSTSSQAKEIAGLQTPESVYYDTDQDVYFISNINGDPTAADNNGYIAKVNPDTLAVEKFIEAGKNGVTLNAPKGLTILHDTLYAADLDTVRMFDDKSGAPKGEVRIPGATFLNDLTNDGKVVYVSDSGMKAGTGGNFDPTGTDAVWQISGTKATKIASGKELNRPNGLEVVDGKVWAVSFASNELYDIEKGRKANVVKLPKGSLDGLVHMSDGTFVITSWESNSVFRGPQSGPFTEIITDVKSPADSGYDTKRHLLLVPHFMENKVTIHDLQ